MKDSKIEGFIADIRYKVEGSPVFDPWWEVDPENDKSPSGPLIRRRQLKHYLSLRRGKARLLLLGEALGYQGGHFTGIAMTSERILLKNSNHPLLNEVNVLDGLEIKRTSKEEIKVLGFSEPTATIVWRVMLEAGLESEQFIIWNAFPWHPHRKGDLLSNRTPTENEIARGLPFIKRLIDSYDFELIVAVGNKASAILNIAGIEHSHVRHPANGGAKKFATQMQALLSV